MCSRCFMMIMHTPHAIEIMDFFRSIVLISLGILLISCQSGMKFDKDKSANLNGKNVKIMASYTQPFANPQLNSLLGDSISCEGKLEWKIKYNPNEIVGSPRELFLLDRSKAILDYAHIFFVIDIAKREVIGFQDKSTNTFMVIKDGRSFYCFYSYLLFCLDVNSFQDQSGNGYFTPGLGEFSELELLAPSEDTFVAGIRDFGNPEDPLPSFSLLKKYNGELMSIWELNFPDLIVKPPMSKDGDFVIAREGIISIIGSDGAIKNEIKDEFSPIWCSIGEDKLIYLICRTEKECFVRALDFEGNVQWECETSIDKPNQPPIVSNESMVYIIGSSKVEALAYGDKLWEFPLESNEEMSQIATVTNNGMLLVSDGNRVVCLNKSGEAVWIYKSKQDETFMTQPIVDSNGKVLVVSDKNIVSLK
jgi:outer membrane protein assembly factor BamB